MKRKICAGILLLLFMVLPASAFEVWHDGFDERTGTYLLVVFNEQDIAMSNVAIQIGDAEPVTLTKELPPNSRVNYRITEPGMYDIFVSASNSEPAQFFTINVQRDKMIEPAVAEKLQQISEQREKDEQERQLKADERERELAMQDLQASSQGEIVALEQKRDLNTLFVKVIIILFIVVGGIALYEFVITKSRGGRR